MWPKPNKIPVKLKTPHRQQRRFIESAAKRKIIRAGRCSGKTTGAAVLGVREFIKGRRVLYTAPTEEQTGAFWAEVKGALGQAVSEGVFTKNETERFIEKPGTSQRIKAATAWDSDSLRSDYADLLIIDEWQLCAESLWETVGAPLLLDHDGSAVFIYTPPSLHSRSVSKARDPRHAAKMFKVAQQDRSGRWETFHFSSHDNPHISKNALAEITMDMTVLAFHQEILAEDTEEIPGALWKQTLLDQTRVDKAPELVRVVVGIDPSGSATTEAGIVAAGIDGRGHGYVLADASMLAPSPRNWAAKGVSLFQQLKADRIVGERNYGGDMVEETVRTVDQNVSYHDVVSTRGKLLRGEPVCALYEKGFIHHVGNFPELEGEMCSYIPGDKSPNRLDAAVFALTELMLGSQTLGVLDYFASGQAAADLRTLDTARPATPGPIVTRPSLPPREETGQCPKCGSACVIVIAGQGRHCNCCSWQWYPRGQPEILTAGFKFGRPTIYMRRLQ